MSAARIDRRIFDRAVALLRTGGIIAFPTETYYALGADPSQQGALKRLYSIKQRTRQKPVLVLAADLEQCRPLLSSPIEPSFTLLASQYWPGPLTLVHKAADHVVPEITGGTGTIGLRQSPHPVVQELLLHYKHPVTGTSANISGLEGAVTARQVREMFPSGIDLILDGGRTPGKIASTLVKCSHNTIQCLRMGKIDYRTVFDYWMDINQCPIELG